jgi:hypothetical protein
VRKKVNFAGKIIFLVVAEIYFGKFSNTIDLFWKPNSKTIKKVSESR